MPRAAASPETGLTEKQGRFCEAFISNGGNATAAYRESYDTKGAEATVNRAAKELMDNPKIGARISTLRAQVTDAAMEDATVDKAWVLRRLKTVAQRCLQAEPVLDRKGNQVLVETPSGEMVPAFVFNPMGANRALELLGKECNMFIEKQETGAPGAFEDKETVRKRVQRRMVHLGLAKVVNIETAKKAKKKAA